MRYWDAVLAAAVALVAALVITPATKWLAVRIGAVDRQTDRGLAKQPTPRLGGLAILAGVVLASVLWLPATFHIPRVAHSLPGSQNIVHSWSLIAGAALIALVGAIDDWHELPPGVKLVGQIAAAVVAVEGGAVVSGATIPFVGAVQFPNGGGILTVIWLVGVMNVVNFSDGVDGLAAGLCTIDGLAFAIIAFDLQGGGSVAAVLAALTAGGAAGFLFHNFPPAKVFMGDSGANLLGYLLGVAAVIGAVKTETVVALVVPLFVLAVPFLDTSFVVAKRLKYGRAPWSADANHFHHRMARIGFSQRKTVAYLYSWTLLLALVALALRFVPYSDHHGHYRLGWGIVMIAIALLAVAASVYLVFVLEILKFKHLRTGEMRRSDPETSEHEIEVRVTHDLETGEFERVGK